MRAFLAPLQLGYGTPHGSEAAAHAAHIYLQNLPSDHLLLKLDFKNAFNCLHRDRMLTVVREKVPELLPLVHSAYSSPSHLFIGDEIIQSSEGVQQGDPLGPLLFCLTIHSIVSQLRSELRIFYMDDGTLGGSLDDVLDDLHTVRNAAEDFGLHLNLTKSEVICVDPRTKDTMLNAAHDLCIVSPDQATLLGSPIGSIASINNAIRTKVNTLKIIGSWLHHLHAHDVRLLSSPPCIFYPQNAIYSPFLSVFALTST